MNKLNSYNQRLERKKKKELELNKLSIKNIGPLAPNNNFEENLKNYVNNNKIKSSRNQLYKSENEKIKEIFLKKNIINKSSIFSSITNDQIQNIHLNNIKVMTKNNINLSLNNFEIDELLFKFINTMNSNDIKTLNSNYFTPIINSNSCYFQESILFFNPEEINNDTETKNNEINDYSIMITPRIVSSKTQILSNTVNFSEKNNLDNLTIKDFFNQIEILNYFLEFYSRFDTKKMPKLIQLKFNLFKCNISQQNKMIQIFFNFSKIKEKLLFEFLKEVKNMFLFIQSYTTIIKSLKEFKLYQSTIRVSQTNFRSNQLNYIFNLITHKIVDFIEDNSYNKISIYETQLNNYNPNMKIFLKDFSLKKRNMYMTLKLILFKFPFFNKIKFIIEYLTDFVEQWDLIVLSDSYKDIKLLKSFNDNKLFIFLLKEKESNNNKNLISVINNNKNNNNENNNNKKKNKNQSSLRRKESDNKNKEYEYLNIILYIRNSRQDYISIFKTMELFLSNKNSELDFKTNLICDRIFFEENIMNDNKFHNLQLVLLNMIDDFFLVTKTFGSINREYLTNKNETNNSKIIKSLINEHYNYDFFIGDDFVGVLNNRLYDFTSDINNNFSNLIYDFLSVLSTCLEFIYYILKIKCIFILRFVYIIHAKNNCYYSLEIKNWNFFIKKMTDFSSLFTANIKISKPLLCFIKKKINANAAKNIDEAMEDNFYDIFLRLFLNLNKVVKKEELNQEFFKKLHKNIFKDYLYDLVAFSYEAFVIVNKFFISNNYLNISKGEKFENCYIIPSQGFFDKINYLKILELFEKNEYDEEGNNLIVKNILVFNFGIDFNYIFKNKDKMLFGFSKISYFIGEYNNYIFNKILTENKNKKDLLKKKFESKKTDKNNINKYLKIIDQFQLGNYDQDEKDNNDNKNINTDIKNTIVVYNTSIKLYNSIIEDYTHQKILAQAQKNELNLFKNEDKTNTDKQTMSFEEENINIHRECYIY